MIATDSLSARTASFLQCKSHIKDRFGIPKLVRLGFVYDLSRSEIICSSCKFVWDRVLTNLDTIFKEHKKFSSNCQYSDRAAIKSVEDTFEQLKIAISGKDPPLNSSSFKGNNDKTKFVSKSGATSDYFTMDSKVLKVGAPSRNNCGDNASNVEEVNLVDCIEKVSPTLLKVLNSALERYTKNVTHNKEQSDDTDSGRGATASALCGQPTITGSEIQQQAKHPGLSTREERRRTFRGQEPKYSHSIHHNIIDRLVEAGLYYVGPTDNVRCFFCDGGLKNFSRDDEPFTEHKKWFSQCKYVMYVEQTRRAEGLVRASEKQASEEGRKKKEEEENTPADTENLEVRQDDLTISQQTAENTPNAREQRSGFPITATDHSDSSKTEKENESKAKLSHDTNNTEGNSDPKPNQDSLPDQKTSNQNENTHDELEPDSDDPTINHQASGNVLPAKTPFSELENNVTPAVSRQVSGETPSLVTDLGEVIVVVNQQDDREISEAPKVVNGVPAEFGQAFKEVLLELCQRFDNVTAEKCQRSGEVSLEVHVDEEIEEIPMQVGLGQEVGTLPYIFDDTPEIQVGGPARIQRPNEQVPLPLNIFVREGAANVQCFLVLLREILRSVDIRAPQGLDDPVQIKSSLEPILMHEERDLFDLQENMGGEYSLLLMFRNCWENTLKRIIQQQPNQRCQLPE